jgi:hypothetical protein
MPIGCDAVVGKQHTSRCQDSSGRQPEPSGPEGGRWAALSRRKLFGFLAALAAQCIEGPALARQPPEPPQYNMRQFVLMLVGVLQPVSVESLHRFLTRIFDAFSSGPLGDDLPGEPPDLEAIGRLLTTFLEGSDSERPKLIRVGRAQPPAYSLTAAGSDWLPPPLRRARDRTRLFLLPRPRRIRLQMSHESDRGRAGGDAPLLNVRLPFEEMARPTRHHTDARWSSQVADFRSGPEVLSRDTILPYLSFATASELQQAGALDNEGRITQRGFALTLGVSDALLQYLVRGRFAGNSAPGTGAKARRRGGHYREFKIAKRNGGERTIHAPRYFLKVVQRFILDFYLQRLPVHDAVHSFRRGRGESARNHWTNAQAHTRKRFVVTFDITDFFGSITSRNVRLLLQKSLAGVGKNLAMTQASAADSFPPLDPQALELIVKLCTILRWIEGRLLAVLPQGSPTSPQISNAILFEFDTAMSRIVEEINNRTPGVDMKFTRYADDIALSGQSRAAVISAFLIGRRLLWSGGGANATPNGDANARHDRDSKWPARRLQVNGRKSRFMGKGRQQLVTGIVVNERGLPARDRRRLIRAMFHNASLDPQKYRDRVNYLYGYLGYFKSVGAMGPEEIDEYRNILKKVVSESR